MYFDERENHLDYTDNENIYYYNSNENYEKNNKINFDTDFKTNLELDNLIINNYRGSNETAIDPKEGFNKGNMFKELYNPYKNHSYKVVVTGKKDELLLRIQELTFATKDLNLYLDLFPNNKEKLSLFNKYNTELAKLKMEYDRLYSPLCVSDMNNTNTFDWINSPWPWDNKGGNK